METFLIKTALALLLGGALGLEREYHDKPAGFATNCLICLGAMIFTALSLQTNGDSGRIAAQIVSGVGFLGAGSILRDGNKISGLTTAAGVWLVAAIGMAIGYGAFMWAAVGTAAALLLQLGVRRTLDLVERIRHYDVVHITCRPEWRVVDAIRTELEQQEIRILKMNVNKQNDLFQIMLTATFTDKEFQTVIRKVLEMPEVHSLYK